MKFINVSENLGDAIAGTYEISMVAVSVLIASIGAYAAFAFSERIRATHTPVVKWSWLICGALAMGTGVWAMHFVGMLAYLLPFSVTYDAFVTVLSIIPAVLAGGIALYATAGSKIGYRNIVLGGTCMGLGIGTMHYTGMAAMHMDAVMRYDPSLFALSILVAAVLAIIALYLEARIVIGKQTPASVLGGIVTALVMGAAISGMHYTAMTATYFFQEGRTPTPALALDHTMLAMLVVSFAVALIALLYTATAVGRRLEAAGQLEKAQTDLVSAIETIADGFVIFDERGRLIMTNSIFRTLHPKIAHVFEPGTLYEDFLRVWVSHQDQDTMPEGLSIDECVHQQSQTLFATGSSDQERHIGDRWLHVKERKTGDRGLVGVWSDITRFKEMQGLLEQMAHHDPLTGLANRHLFDDRLRQAIARAKRHQLQVALLYIDLDKFKPINDSLGHEAGDAVLKEVTLRLKACVRETDTVARLGGDEFAVIVEGKSVRETAVAVAQRILPHLSRPIEVAGTKQRVGASIGVSIYPCDSDNVETLLRNADAAMYQVKKTGRHNVCFHSDH
jgi:diguanylate cyclase (GGDEF)-like protein